MASWVELLVALGSGSVTAGLLKLASWLHTTKREKEEDEWRKAVLQELRRR